MAVEKVIKLKVENGEALINVQELNKALADTNKQTDNLNETMSSATESIDKFTGGAASGFKAVVSGVKTFLGSLTTLKGALIATGLGALVVVLGSLFTYFTQTSRGADQFAKIMGGVSAAVKVVLDRVIGLGESLVKLFSGDFKGAVEGVKNAFKGLGDEIARETREGARLAEQLDNIEDRERDLIKLRATANKEIAKARLIADDETKSIQEREKAVRKAFELENNVAKAEQKNAQAYVNYLKEQIALSESTDEDLRQLSEAQAKVSELQTENLRRNRRLEIELKGLRTEAKTAADEETKALEERTKKELEAGEERKKVEREVAEIQKKVADEKKLQQSQAVNSFNDALAQFRASNMTAQQQELAAAEQQYLALTTLAIKAGKDTTAVTAEYEEKKKQIKKKYADEERAREVAAAAQSVELVSQSLGAIAGLVDALGKGNEKNAEKNFKITKALRIAEAVASTAAAIMTQLAVPQDALTGANFVKAGIVAVTGATQIATIANTKFNSGGATGGRVSQPSIPTSSPTAQPMTPNIRFQSVENQLAGIAGQPMRAYVVNQDITNANQLERRIRSSATIGG
jgi:chemotaxis protein histidine kinase CheA